MTMISSHRKEGCVAPKSAILVSTSSPGYGHHRDPDIRHRRVVAGGGLAVARTLTKKGGASTASCQCGFEGGTRPHADLLTFTL
jgi:hypothetical protein